MFGLYRIGITGDRCADQIRVRVDDFHTRASRRVNYLQYTHTRTLLGLGVFFELMLMYVFSSAMPIYGKWI